MGLLKIAAFSAFGLFSILVLVEDLRRLRIPNRLLKLGVTLIVIILALHAVTGLRPRIGLGVVNIRVLADYFNFGLNFFFAAVSAMALWFFGFWPAGDAKLFILSSAFVLLGGFSEYRSPFDFVLRLLIDCFFPAAGIYLLIAFVAEIRHLNSRGLKGACGDLRRGVEGVIRQVRVQYRKGFVMIFNLAGFFLLLSILSGQFKNWPQLGLSPGFLCVATFAAWRIVFKGLNCLRWKMWLLAGPTAMWAFMASPNFFAEVSGALKSLAGFGILLGVGRRFLRSYFDYREKSLLPVSALKEGDTLCAASLDKVRAVSLFKDDFSKIYPDGLSLEQVGAFKKAAALLPREFGSEVGIVRAVPFGPWILLGSWSYIFGIDFLGLMRRLF